MNVLIHPFLAGEQPDSTVFDPSKVGVPSLSHPDVSSF